MKRLILIVSMVMALTAATYWLCHHLQTRPMEQLAARPDAEMAWLAEEFQLSPEQRARIAALQVAYEPRCMAMCQQITDNRTRLDRLISQGRRTTPDMDALLEDSARIQVECRREMLEHIYAVAAVMSPEQGARFVARLKAQVLQPGTPHQMAER